MEKIDYVITLSIVRERVVVSLSGLRNGFPSIDAFLHLISGGLFVNLINPTPSSLQQYTAFARRATITIHTTVQNGPSSCQMLPLLQKQGTLKGRRPGWEEMRNRTVRTVAFLAGTVTN